MSFNAARRATHRFRYAIVSVAGGTCCHGRPKPDNAARRRRVRQWVRESGPETLVARMQNFGGSCRRTSAPSRGRSVDPFLLLPGAHPVGHAFVEISRTDGGFYTARIRSRTWSRTRTKAKVMPRLCNSSMEFSNVSQALVSIKSSESASRRTCLAGGRALGGVRPTSCWRSEPTVGSPHARRLASNL